MDAWQISAVTEEEGRNRFYTKITSLYTAFLFVMASGVIVFTRVVPHVLFASDYYEAWRYIPLLTITVVFTCLVNFLGSIYMVEKKSVRSLLTALLSAVINVALNLLWIPRYGVNGAAAATLVCYAVVFIVRMIDTRRYIRIEWQYTRLLLCSGIVLAQTVVMLCEVPLYWLWQVVLFAATAALCGNDLFAGVRHLLKR